MVACHELYALCRNLAINVTRGYVLFDDRSVAPIYTPVRVLYLGPCFYSLVRVFIAWSVF